jgi:hypothetical protein
MCSRWPINGKVKSEIERDRPQSKDGGDGGGGVFLIGVDGALRGNDCRDPADAGAHGQQRRELRPELEGVAQPGHERQRERERDEDKDQRDAAKFEDVSKDEASAEQDDARLQPELVRGDPSAKDARQADCVGDEDAEENRPEHVLDVGQNEVVSFAVGVDEVLDELAGKANDRQQRDARKQAEQG